MPFKIRINFMIPQADGRENWIKIQDHFTRDYFFDLETIYNKVYPEYKRDAAVEYFEKKLGVENDIFRIKNKTPRKRIKILLSFKYMFPIGEGLVTEVGSNELKEEKIYLKVQKTKKLKMTKDDFVMKISIEKTDVISKEYDDSNSEQRAVVPYKPCHSSDSEIDFQDPNTYTCTFYNHNGILAATTCKLISRGSKRQTRITRYQQLPEETEKDEEHTARRP